MVINISSIILYCYTTSSVLGIYARETGQGMIFSNDSGASDSLEHQDEVEETRSRPHLRVVK